MNFNIHPMFVHFPLTLFILYSLFEICRFKILTCQSFYFYIKALLVIIGSFAAYPTIVLGVLAKLHYTDPILKPVVTVHEIFAITTTVIFTIVAVLYIIGWMRRSNSMFLSTRSSSGFWNFLLTLETLITEKWFGIVVALIGLLLISTTGALGGLAAWGPQNDPISHILYQLLANLGIVSNQ